MKDWLIPLFLLAAFAFAGWYAYEADSQASAGTKELRLPSGYHSVVVSFRGRPLDCLIRDGDGYGMGSGMSCDWTRYHQAVRR